MTLSTKHLSVHILYESRESAFFIPGEIQRINRTIKDNTFTLPKGGVMIDGIPSSNSKYKIVEVSSPAGYIINDKEPAEFEVKAGRLTQTHKTGVSFSSTGNVFTIPNTPGAALPNTGGPGTRIFTILGSILIAGAGLLLVMRRKKWVIQV